MESGEWRRGRRREREEVEREGTNNNLREK